MSSRTKQPKKRLDVLLVERGLAESRQRAQAMILAGEVRVAGHQVTKAGAAVPLDAHVQLTASKLKYASRGGLKLEGALEDFGVEVAGRVCLDAGASTGGFTDCLLQRGAARVYAVDVNTSQLDWRLRQDPRVVQVELNVRAITVSDIGEAVDLITVDLSFISVTKVLPALVKLAKPNCEFQILVKPQFELEKKDVGRGGIVRDARLHQRAIESVSTAAHACGLEVRGVKPSRLPGAEGNQEYFLYAVHRGL
jgi:23S rRNA (cytidine1920-2'-O)/16S rRNA (cytidine1409-2'-O)-methyltransferase